MVECVIKTGRNFAFIRNEIGRKIVNLIWNTEKKKQMSNAVRQLAKMNECISAFHLWFVAIIVVVGLFFRRSKCVSIAKPKCRTYIPLVAWFVEQRRCHRLNGLNFGDRTVIVSLSKYFRYTKVCIRSCKIRCIWMFYGRQFLVWLQIYASRNGCDESWTIWNLVEYAIAALCCVN